MSEKERCTVEIDWQVRQAIEAERRGFDDSPNAALRRLLGIDPLARSALDVSLSPEARHRVAVSSANWSWKGVTLPPGTELRVEYSEVRAEGRVARGLLDFDGEGFKTPSAAVMEMVRRQREDSKATHINGWQYIHVLLPGESQFKPLQVVRKAQMRAASGAGRVGP